MLAVLVLAWMSVLSALVRTGPPGSPLGDWLHLATQAAITLSVMIEAGSEESGRDSSARSPLRILSFLLFSLHVVLSCVPG